MSILTSKNDQPEPELKQTQLHLGVYVLPQLEQQLKPPTKALSADLRSNLSTPAQFPKLENKRQQT